MGLSELSSPVEAPVAITEGARRRHWAAAVFSALFLALSLFYNATIPLWESDNEWSHYQYIRTIVLTGRLPAPDSTVSLSASADSCADVAFAEQIAAHQFRQPPLYYLLGSLVVRDLDISDTTAPTINPHLHSGDGGLNVAVHAPPQRGTALAVHRLRLLSGLIGLAGLIPVYLSGLLLFPGRRRLALALLAINAFVPQYVFSASVINNDILAGALGAWCLYFCLAYALQRPRALVLALAVLAAALSITAKYSGLALLPALALALALRLGYTWHHRRSEFAGQLGRAALVLLVAAAPLTIWLLQNSQTTGHAFGSYAEIIAVLQENPQAHPAAPPATVLPLRSTQFALMTFWGLFGNDNIALPGPLLLVLQAVALLAAAGAIWAILDRRGPAALRMALLAAFVVLLGAWSINLVKAAGTGEPRGRYFLPVYLLISLLLVAGIDRLLPRRWRAGGAVVLPALLLLISLAVPLLLLRPTYAPPASAASADLLPGEQPLYALFGDNAELLGYRIEPDQLTMYNTATVTLVWRARQATTNSYTVAVDLLNGDNQSLYRVARFPGNGNLATSLWQPGMVFRDVYRVALGPTARPGLPSLGRIKVSMYCYAPQKADLLPVSDQAGTVLGDSVVIGRMRLADNISPAAPAAPPLYRFGDALALQAVTVTPDDLLLGPDLQIELQWLALAQPAQDYTVFAHLDDAQGHTATAFDLPLTDGRYPSGLWQAGDLVTHHQRVPLPPTGLHGPYVLRLGVYDPSNGARLPVTDTADISQANSEIVLGPFHPPNGYLFLPVVEISTDR